LDVNQQLRQHTQEFVDDSHQQQQKKDDQGGDFLWKKDESQAEQKWEVDPSQENLESLRAEINQLETKNENDIMKKKEVIQKLFKCIQKNEDQRHLVGGIHFKTIDDVINTHEHELDEIENSFLQIIQNSYERYNQNQAEISSLFESDRKVLLECIQQLEKVVQQESSKEEKVQVQEIEEIKNKSAEDMKNLRHLFDSQLEELGERSESTKNEFLQMTELQSENLQKQMLKNTQITKEMTNVQHKLDKLRIGLRRIRRLSSQKSMQNIDRCNLLMKRKSQIICRYKTAKAIMEKMSFYQHNKLQELTLRAHEKKSKLQNELSVAENVLKLAKLVHKLEHQYEEISGDKLSRDYQQGRDLIASLIHRYNKVLMNMKEMTHKEKVLLERNRHLHDKLQFY
jgi:hypothetical protein